MCRMMLSLAVGALVLSGCASTGKDYHSDVDYAKIARIEQAARAVGVSSAANDAKAAQDLVYAIDELARVLGTPTRLSAIGLPDGEFEQIADDVMGDPQTYWNPRQASARDVADWLRSAW